MKIKKVKWSECIVLPGSSIKNHDSKKPPSRNIKIKKGTNISAKYGESDVHMEITEAQNNGNFIAKIKFFEPVNVAKPEGLSEGDCVQIDSGHICWIFDK